MAAQASKPTMAPELLRSPGWTDGFAEGSVGARPCGNWNIFLAGSGQWGPIAIQPKGDSKCHRCVCG